MNKSISENITLDIDEQRLMHEKLQAPRQRLAETPLANRK